MAEVLSPTPTVEKVLGRYTKDDSIPATKPGEAWLSECSNVDVNDQGEPSRRDGFELLQAGDFHSLGGTEFTPLVVRDNNLNLILSHNPYSDTTLVRAVGPNTMVYEEFWNRVYCTNNQIIRYVQDQEIHSLASVHPFGKRQMVPGHLMTSLNNRLLVARDEYIIVSDAGAPDRYDEEKGFVRLKHKVRLLMAVKDGFFTSDDYKIMFYKALPGGLFQKEDKAAYGAVEGTAARYKGAIVNGKEVETFIFMRTQEGICIAYDGGGFENVTNSRITLTKVNAGTGFIKKGSFLQYITIVKG